MGNWRGEENQHSGRLKLERGWIWLEESLGKRERFPLKTLGCTVEKGPEIGLACTGGYGVELVLQSVYSDTAQVRCTLRLIQSTPYIPVQAGRRVTGQIDVPQEDSGLVKGAVLLSTGWETYLDKSVLRNPYAIAKSLLHYPS